MCLLLKTLLVLDVSNHSRDILSTVTKHEISSPAETTDSLVALMVDQEEEVM